MKIKHIALISVCLLNGMGWAVVGQAHPATTTTRAMPGQQQGPLSTWQPVSDKQLAAMRGGFDFGNGLNASFGISRAVYINGVQELRTSVNIPDLSHITVAQANALAAALATHVISNGPGNSFDPASFGPQMLGATVIQNSLNNQKIQSMTTIDTTVNDLEFIRSMNLQQSLQSALINSRGQ